MRKRMYFLLPDVKHASQTVDDLLLARIEERYIHVMAKEGTNLKDLPEATMSQKSDFIHGMELGLVIGGLTGILIGILVLQFPPEGLSVSLGAVLIFALMGAIFGIWVSGMIGLDAPNSQLKQFEKALARGKILMMIDVPQEKIDAVKAIMKKRHPEADAQGLEPTLPAFP